MKLLILAFTSLSVMSSNTIPVSWTKYLIIFLLGSAILCLRAFKKSFKQPIVNLLFVFCSKEIAASALSFLFCQSEWLNFCNKLLIYSFRSWCPLTWTSLVFSIFFPFDTTLLFEGVSSDGFLSLETFLAGIYLFTSLTLLACPLLIFLSTWLKKSSPKRIFILPIFLTIVSLTSATPSVSNF